MHTLFAVSIVGAPLDRISVLRAACYSKMTSAFAKKC
jgi:hypothetical protein